MRELGVYEKLEKELLNVKDEAKQEIINVLKDKQYGPTDVATAYGQQRYKAWSIVYDKYGNGIIVADAENGDETHIDNLSTDDTLDVLAAALHAIPNMAF